MIRSVVFALLLASTVFAQEQSIDWRSDYSQALKDAKAANKPIFLEFRCEA